MYKELEDGFSFWEGKELIRFSGISFALYAERNTSTDVEVRTSPTDRQRNKQTEFTPRFETVGIQWHSTSAMSVSLFQLSSITLPREIYLVCPKLTAPELPNKFR